MSMPQVGQGAVAVVPTFKGFRSAVNKETDAAASDSAKGFRSVWSKEGSTSGRATGAGFRKAFQGESSGFSDKATRELEQNVAKASRALSQARLKQLDQAGRVRVAEAQLTEAQAKHAVGSSQVTRAMERLASETRKLESANESTASSTEALKDAQSQLATAADRAGDQLGESGRSSARKFSSGFSDVFKGSFLGTTVAGLASSLVSNIGNAIGTGLRNAVEFAFTTVDIASDLNESVNAVRVAYGEASDALLALGEDSATSFGLSKRNLNSFSVQFSAFARTIRGNDVAGFIEELITRGSDFASVFNLEVADALTLFQSGLAGETEPLRRFGIDLSAAAVEAHAYATGIAAGGEELTEAQKQQARYSLLLQQTAQVQGDFANTSDALANKNRINAATWENLQARIGEGFLPIMSSLATILSEDVFPVIEEMIDEHGPELQAAFEAALPALQQLAVDVLPLLPGLFDSIAQTLPGLISLISTMAPLVLWVTQLYTGWFTAMDGLFAFLRGDTTLVELHDKLVTIPGPMGDILRAASNLGMGMASALLVAKREVANFAADVDRNVQSVIRWFQELPGRIGSFFSGAGSWLYNSGKSLIQGFIDGIEAMFRPVGDAVSGVLSWARGFFPSSPAKRGPFSGPGWDALKDSGSAVIEQWASGMDGPEISARITPSLSAKVASPFSTAAAASTPRGASASDAKSGPARIAREDLDYLVRQLAAIVRTDQRRGVATSG